MFLLCLNGLVVTLEITGALVVNFLILCFGTFLYSRRKDDGLLNLINKILSDNLLTSFDTTNYSVSHSAVA